MVLNNYFVLFVVWGLGFWKGFGWAVCFILYGVIWGSWVGGFIF